MLTNICLLNGTVTGVCTDKWSFTFCIRAAFSLSLFATSTTALPPDSHIRNLKTTPWLVKTLKLYEHFIVGWNYDWWVIRVGIPNKCFESLFWFNFNLQSNLLSNEGWHFISTVSYLNVILFAITASATRVFESFYIWINLVFHNQYLPAAAGF